MRGGGRGELKQARIDGAPAGVCVCVCVSLGGLYLCLFVSKTMCIFSWLVWTSFKRMCVSALLPAPVC